MSWHAGRVAEILIAAGAGQAPQTLPRVRAVAGAGLLGDRYAAGVGHWSWWPGNGKHLTLIAQEDLDAIRHERSLELRAAELRRNVLTTGIDLSTLLGKRFAIGEALCLGVRPCDPCRYLEERTRPGVWDALIGRGGLRADILIGGWIHVGDAVRLVEQLD